ncbi:hypothetical protein [Thermogymnomonas acidicola]|uniref:hypothetical protein n=1 Tax=Thermogymnomonas acidicola TaxID=399579 RepID=UPI0014950284|nr:hypothetical protein [Thermogymnomonas acidicola]
MKALVLKVVLVAVLAVAGGGLAPTSLTTPRRRTLTLRPGLRTISLHPRWSLASSATTGQAYTFSCRTTPPSG